MSTTNNAYSNTNSGGGRGRWSSHGLEGWPPLPGHTGEPGTVLAIGPVFRAAGVMSSGVDAAGSVPQ